MNTKEQFVIALNREAGSGGRTTGRILAEKLGVQYYDKLVLESLIDKFGLQAGEIEEIKAKTPNWWTEFSRHLSSAPTFDFKPKEKYEVTSQQLFAQESRILKEAAAAGSCVIAGRLAFHVLKGNPNMLSVFIHAPLEKRIERTMQKQPELSRDEAIALLERLDGNREKYTLQFAGVSRYDLRNYDLTISSDGKSEEEIAGLILDFIGWKQGE